MLLKLQETQTKSQRYLHPEEITPDALQERWLKRKTTTATTNMFQIQVEFCQKLSTVCWKSRVVPKPVFRSVLYLESASHAAACRWWLPTGGVQAVYFADCAAVSALAGQLQPSHILCFVGCIGCIELLTANGSP